MKTIAMKNDRRLMNVNFEVRDNDEKETYIEGYALKFNEPSEDLGFIEYIDRNALDGADMDNVVALLNHDSNYVLGRSGRNLTLEVDEIGLRFSVKPTETSYSKDLIENMRSGLIDKCSFAFSLDYSSDEADEWKKQEDGSYVRMIKKIDRLFDVSVVTTPAYADTVALLSTRSMKEFEKVKFDRNREIELMDMELKL